MEKKAVIIDHLTFTYAGASKPSLRDVSFEIKEGEFVAILGKTGAGKSSLLRVISGAIPHFYKGELKGEVRIDGLEPRSVSLSELAKHVGYVCEDPEIHIVSFTVEEDIAFGPINLNLPEHEVRRRIDFALEATKLKGLERRNPYHLSGGEKQSLAIAGVLALLPKIMALDEPTAMLDPLGKKRIYSIVKELNEKYRKTIIMAGQEVEIIFEFIPRVLVLAEGEVIYDGSPRELVEERQILKRAGLRCPPVTELAWRLREAGKWDEPLPLTLREAHQQILNKMAHKAKLTKTVIGKSAGLTSKHRQIAIKVRNLYHIYPDGTRALNGVSIDIGRGEFVAIIGENGSGKTTLAMHIAGLLKPTNPDAEINVCGIDVTRAPMREIVKRVSYVFQNPDIQLFSRSVYEELSYGPRNLGIPEQEIDERVRNVLKMLELEQYTNMWPRELDRGKRLRVALGSLLTINPEILIVDEPTTGQDWEESRYLMNVLSNLNKKGLTVLFITHDMDLVAEFAHRAIVLHQGRIIADGPPSKVFYDPEALKKTDVEPPQIIRLTMELQRQGVPQYILTVHELYNYLVEVLS